MGSGIAPKLFVGWRERTGGTPGLSTPRLELGGKESHGLGGCGPAHAPEKGLRRHLHGGGWSPASWGCISQGSPAKQNYEGVCERRHLVQGIGLCDCEGLASPWSAGWASRGGPGQHCLLREGQPFVLFWMTECGPPT